MAFSRDSFWVAFSRAGRGEAGGRAARTALLQGAAEELPPEELLTLVEECFRSGDNSEKAAVLSSLAALPDPERFLALGIEACRSNVTSVFEAIAAQNPFPARYFPEPNFNQLVLKAIFVGVPVEQIQGLAGRLNADLRRMLCDYAAERTSASRPVPEDVTHLLNSPDLP